MKTIGRHWSKKAPRGDFQAMCDYCGVQWRRSELRRDRSGMLACPDDVRGKDGVTLSEENALAAAQPRGPMAIRDGGNYDDSGQNYLRHPLSILVSGESRSQLGNSVCKGWWQTEQSGTLGSGGYRWVANLQRLASSGVRAGDVYQPDQALQPPDVEGVPTFTGDYLQSDSGLLVEEGDSPCVWLVGSFTDDGAMFSLDDQLPAGAPDTRGLAVWWDVATEQVSVRAAYDTGTVTLTTPLDTDEHLLSIRMTSTGLVLKVDDEDPVTQPTTGTLARDLDVVTYGGARYSTGTQGLKGTLREVVLSSEQPSSSEFTDMERYFSRTYPELSL